MSRRCRKGATEPGLTERQVVLLRDAMKNDGVYAPCVEQATLKSLERRGFMSEGRKRMSHITQQGRNALEGLDV